MANNKVTTVFDIDRTQFDKSIKDLNKSISQTKKDFSGLSSEAKELAKELTTIGTQLKGIDGMSNLVKDIDKCVAGIKNTNKEFVELNKQISKAQKEMKGFGDVDIKNIKQMQNILKSLKNYDIIKEQDLKEAVSDAKEIARQLNSINGIDTSGLNRRVSNVENSPISAISNINSDSERYLRKIFASVTQIEEKVKNKQNNEEVTKSISDATKKLEAALNRSVKTLARTMGSGGNSSSINTPVVKSNNPFATDEIATVVKLYDQLKESQRQFNTYLQISENDMQEIYKIFQKQCEEADRLNDIMANQRKEQEKVKDAVEGTANAAEQHTDAVDETTQKTSKLRSVYEAVSKLAAKFGINLPDLGEINETRSSVQGLSQALNATSGSSASAGEGMAAFGGAAAATTAAVLAVVAAVVAYAAALKKCIDVMKQASQYAKDFEDATVKLANQLGLTAEGVNQLRDSLNETFRNQGYTTDVNELADAVGVLRQMLGIDTDTDYGKNMLSQMMAVSKTTGYEMKELGKTVNAVSTNFKITQQEALDGIIYMYQVTGDKSNDLLDTFSEYAMKVKDMNMSFTTFLSGIKAGDMAALFNTDKVGQIFEELNDTLTTEADDAVVALNKIGVSYSKVMKGIKSGGKDAQDAFYAIIEGINDVEDTAKRQEIISELFKSPGQEVSTEFFELLEQAQVGMEELSGTASRTAENIKNTFTYQMNEAQNNVASAWDKIGEKVNTVITPILRAFNDNFDEIIEVIETDLAPAFYDLAIAIASAFNIDTPQNFADGLVSVVKGLASVIKFIAQVTFYVGKLVSAIRIVWNVLQILYDGFKAGIMVIGAVIASFIDTVLHGIQLIATTVWEFLVALKDSILDILAWLSKKLVWIFEALVTTIIDTLALVVKGVGNILVSFVTSFDDAFLLIIKAAGNLGLGIVNAVVVGAKKAYNGFLKYFVNPCISAANLLPGVSINPIGYADESGAFEYISVKDQLDGLKNAWTSNAFDLSKEYQSIAEVWKKGSSVGDEEGSRIGDVWSKFTQNVSGNYDKINQNFQNWESAIWSTAGDYLGEMGENINGNFDDMNSLLTTLGMSFDEYKDGFENMFLSQEEVANQNADKIVDALKDSNTANSKDYAGKDPTPEDEAKKAAAAEKAKKEYESALEKAKQAQYDFYKNLIDAYFEAQDKMISYETAIAEQRWSTMEEGRELYEDQLAFYQSIMDRYILTTDEMVSYTQQKFDTALQMREWALERAKELIEERVEAEKDALDEEKDALIKANNEKIKEYQKYIREIENEISDLQDEWDKEDEQEEIDKVKAELEKYANATSVEGIKKRNELTEQLNDLLKEQERNQIKDRLEDQKDGWEEQIDSLEDANDSIEEEYENKYKELEETVATGEMTIADIQEAIRDTSNKKLKEQLQEMVDAYESAMQSMQDSTLNMQTILQWQDKDAAMNDTINNLTGEAKDEWSDMVQNSDKTLNPDYVKIKELQTQWAALGDGKTSSNPQIKKQQEALHAQANAIRQKYGIPYPELPPKYLEKYHTGGIVQGEGEVDATLMAGEVVFTQQQFQNVIDFFDYFNPATQLGEMKASPLQSGNAASVVYNDTFNVTIENVNMSSKMDTRQMIQEMEVMRKVKSNAKGKRNI